MSTLVLKRYCLYRYPQLKQTNSSIVLPFWLFQLPDDAVLLSHTQLATVLRNITNESFGKKPNVFSDVTSLVSHSFSLLQRTIPVPRQVKKGVESLKDTEYASSYSHPNSQTPLENVNARSNQVRYFQCKCGHLVARSPYGIKMSKKKNGIGNGIFTVYSSDFFIGSTNADLLSLKVL
ncbi:hypothetical protein RCL1_004058 [Eukaryota sp. TZLM3-RCL]